MLDERGVPGLATGGAGADRQGLPGQAPGGAVGAAGDSASTPAAAGDPCRGLRWKGLFIDSPPDPTIPNPHDGFCWCRHTLTCLGPDGQVAEAAACRPGRRCYEAP